MLFQKDNIDVKQGCEKVEHCFRFGDFLKPVVQVSFELRDFLRLGMHITFKRMTKLDKTSGTGQATGQNGFRLRHALSKNINLVQINQLVTKVDCGLTKSTWLI